MPLNEKLPEWNQEGAEPTQDKKDNGFAVLERPPAGLFDWFFNRVSAVLKEMRDKVMLKEDAEDFASEEIVNAHVQDLTSHVKFSEGTQSGNDITLNLPTTGNTSYKNGMGASFEVKTDATGPLRVRFGTWGYKNVKNQKGVNVNNSKAGSIITVRYSTRNDSFILQGEGSGVDVTNGIININKILQL